MPHNEFHLFSSEDPGRPGSLCARCGTTADIYLTLLGEATGRGGSFCLPCCEVLIHTLQQRHDVPAEVALTSPSFPHPPTHHDEAEGGIIFWEGHGWSSDGPFAGA
jgi:hypothetical protein